MFEPKWSAGDMEHLNTVTLADGESLTGIERMMYRHGSTDERRRLLDALYAGDYPAHVKREFGKVIARGR